jgi:hypothetical protein
MWIPFYRTPQWLKKFIADVTNSDTDGPVFRFFMDLNDAGTSIYKFSFQTEEKSDKCYGTNWTSRLAHYTKLNLHSFICKRAKDTRWNGRSLPAWCSIWEFQGMLSYDFSFLTRSFWNIPFQLYLMLLRDTLNPIIQEVELLYSSFFIYDYRSFVTYACANIMSFSFLVRKWMVYGLNH